MQSYTQWKRKIEEQASSNEHDDSPKDKVKFTDSLATVRYFAPMHLKGVSFGNQSDKSLRPKTMGKDKELY
jgi:hypothetical protein